MASASAIQVSWERTAVRLSAPTNVLDMENVGVERVSARRAGKVQTVLESHAATIATDGALA